MATAEDYAQWITANADKRGTPDFETVAQAYRALRAGDVTTNAEEPVADVVKPVQKQSILDAPNALASGFFRGLTRMAGAPVDAVANVLDLGRAAFGAPYIAATGKEPPKFLQIPDRSDVTGSGENLLRNLGKNKVTSAMVNPKNPDYEGGYLQTIGGGIAGATSPAQAAMGAASAIAGKSAYDSTGSTPLAITASLLAPNIPRGVSAATKLAIRGGEAGRAEMNRRIEVLRQAGVDRPTLGLASGNGALGGVETVLQTVPGSMGVFDRARDAAHSGMQATAGNAADLASRNSGRQSAGAAVQRDLRDFHDRQVVPGYTRNNDLAEGVIGTNTPVTVHNSINRANQLSTPNQGAPATTAIDLDPRFATLRRALISDAGGSPARMDSAGMFYPEIPQVGIPYGALKGKRTRIGADAASLDNIGRPVHGEIRSMYGAMSRDMENAAAQADLQRGMILQTRTPTSASGALTRANNVYSGGLARQERTAPFANNPTPEAAFDALARTPASALSTFQAVKKSITPGTRGSVAATIIDSLGTATPGNQDHTGGVFSPTTFLTNWTKLTPAGRRELFSGFPNADQAHAQVSAVAEAANMMKQNSRHWANPSGTAANTSGRELMRGLGVGVPAALAGFGSWSVPLGVLGCMAGARGASSIMTNPDVVNWAATRTPALAADQMGALGRSMITSGQLEKDQK